MKRSSTKTEAKSATPATDAPHRYCAQRSLPEPTYSPSVGPERVKLIRSNAKAWVNGTELKYYFIGGDEAQKRVVRNAFQEWKGLKIGLTFTEVAERQSSLVRISFDTSPGEGSWSNVGRDILTIPKSQPTMNFGWDISNDLDTAVHEIGHTLGFQHEHQNPFAGIVWDEEAVYADLGGDPNYWPRETTFHNIIRKIAPDSVQGSSWDPNSIMHYPFGKGLILEPKKYRNGLRPASGLSKRDKEWVRTFYPPMPASGAAKLALLVSQPLEAESGGQDTFAIVPSESRNYEVRTFGGPDALMVLVEKNSSGEVYIAGNDDSGQEDNAHLAVRLEAGKTYELRIRTLYRDDDKPGAVMYW